MGRNSGLEIIAFIAAVVSTTVVRVFMDEGGAEQPISLALTCFVYGVLALLSANIIKNFLGGYMLGSNAQFNWVGWPTGSRAGAPRGFRARMMSGLDAMERHVEWFIRICGWSAILFVMAIFFFVIKEGAPALVGDLDLWNFFSSTKWDPTAAGKSEYGILALIVGTLSVTILSMLLAVPLGLGAATYVSEFSGTRTKETLKVLIELLAAIPSVVWGFIGMMVLGPILVTTTGASVGVNMLNGALILALMSVPVIVSVAEDSLRAVPDSYREAALAMGATRWEIVSRVLFPAAKSGLLAAVLLGVGRAIGETMAVLMATGHSGRIPQSLVDPVQTLTATIAAEMGEAPRGGEHYQVLFLIGIVLFAFAFVVNMVADLIVKGIRNEKNG
jgi:phosphate transport system permease protein|tara:strand:- start:80 stop:1243 length:1164 start_codon:yes stop_codon:yes gene_type:complete